MQRIVQAVNYQGLPAVTYARGSSQYALTLGGWEPYGASIVFDWPDTVDLTFEDIQLLTQAAYPDTLYSSDSITVYTGMWASPYPVSKQVVDYVLTKNHAPESLIVQTYAVNAEGKLLGDVNGNPLGIELKFIGVKEVPSEVVMDAAKKMSEQVYPGEYKSNQLARGVNATGGGSAAGIDPTTQALLNQLLQQQQQQQEQYQWMQQQVTQAQMTAADQIEQIRKSLTSAPEVVQVPTPAPVVASTPKSNLGVILLGGLAVVLLSR